MTEFPRACALMTEFTTAGALMTGLTRADALMFIQLVYQSNASDDLSSNYVSVTIDVNLLQDCITRANALIF